MSDDDWPEDEERSPSDGQSSRGNVASQKKENWGLLDDLSAEYDYLGTTPPRTRIRNKGKNRVHTDDSSNPGSPRFSKIIRRNTTDTVITKESSQENYENKKAKRRSLKTLRGHERDLKLDIEKCKGNLMDSGPQPVQVLTNNRFLSLCPQLVQREPAQPKSSHEEIPKSTSVPLTQDYRAVFHETFSMLIKMRTSDKSCKRTVSIEHTWKNELKDLIWLEVTAWYAGRTATQQDLYLLGKRDNVPNLLQQILDYKFVNTEFKCTGGGIWKTQTSVMSVDSGINSSPNEATYDGHHDQIYDGTSPQCLCIDCDACTKSVEKAMNEIETLLNSLAEAESLYSSCKSMSTEHPVVNSDAFLDKVKAMCLWFNMVHHQRLKILILKKIVQKNLTHKKISHTYDRKSDNIIDTETSSKVTFDISNNESVGKNPISVESLNYNESDDDNDVTTKIHIEVTQSKPTNSFDKNELNTESCTENEKLFPISSEHLKSPYESTDSSGGSVLSNESGFVSSVYENSDENQPQMNKNKINVYDLGSLKELTKLRLFNPKIASPYRDYIEKMLKVRGLRRALYFLEKLHVEVLKKARMTLELHKNDNLKSNENDNITSDVNVDSNAKDDNESSDDDFQYERFTRYDVDIDELKNENLELRRYGAWSKETLDMCLPSYRNIFLLLSTIPIETIHEFLTMRLETKPEKPSALSIKQLIQELREGLAIAVRLRGRFTRHVSTALMAEKETSLQRKFYANVVATFDDTLNKVYKLYLSYLSDWATMEHLPRTSLLAEWTFNRYLAQRLYLATTLSPLTFCCLTIRQLEGAAVRLKTRILELKNTALLFALGLTKTDEPEDMKLGVLKVCRDIQSLLTEERERVLSTAQFARIVSKHLYHNEVYRSYRRNIYKAMACVLSVLRSLIKKLQDTTTPKRLSEVDELDRPSIQLRTKEIISQTYKFGFEFHKEMYYLIEDGILSEDPKSKPKLKRSDSVCSDSIQSSIDENEFPFTPFTPTSSLSEFVYPVNYKLHSKDEEALKFSLYGHQRNFKTSSQFDKKFNEEFLSQLGPEDFKNVPGCEKCSGTVFCDNELNSCDMYPKAEYNSPDCNWHRVISKNLIEFSEEWMTFVITRCERGKGRRPRWATHGLEFLVLTCDPQHTKYLTDKEFEKMKAMMDGCISHVIGSSAVKNIGSSQSSQTPTTRARISLNYPNNFNKSFQSVSPSTPPTEYSQNLLFNTETIDSVRHEKQIAALNELDMKRDTDLRKTNVIGSIKHNKESRDHFRPRPVKFKWQRGIKIGQGRFGKVYTVVNIESGQLLAMKEIGLGIGDRRSFDRAANELQILEGVVHPNLVRYYGVEIYREEMLIFMELCVEGSLESLIANCNNTDGNGLPEQLVRRYTGQIVSAVIALHERSIAHRDIKSGNIFLTEEGNCLKLGDFGCAVKIRANTTVPGELQGFVGTQAYMAPEVFMKSSGHGRAADIWSLGCVVIEMASGKHPWSECDSNYQIMYKVGTGNRPDIPNTLSQEGKEFCISCLQHDPTERATAANLAQHHFLKVN